MQTLRWDLVPRFLAEMVVARVVKASSIVCDKVVLVC